MSKEFDPYYQWLGIRPEDQPPNHYQLLGLREFEPNDEVIENAADRQMKHLRQYQSGKHGDVSQKLLNEVSAAKLCLLKPAKKKAYDAELKSKLKPATPAQTQPRVTSGGRKLRQAGKSNRAAEPQVAVKTGEDESPASAAFARRRRSSSPILLIGGGVAALLVVGGMAALLLSGGSEEPLPSKPGPEPPIVAEGTLLLNWPEGERGQVRLTINGKAVPFPASGALEHSVPPGEYTISATRHAYRPLEEKVTVTAGNQREISWRWEPEALLVIALPEEERSGATIEIDGQPLPETASMTQQLIELALVQGEHKITVRREGHVPHEENLTLALGSRSTVTPKLVPNAYRCLSQVGRLSICWT